MIDAPRTAGTPEDQILGIDLGTTNSVVAVLTEDGPIVLHGPHGTPLVPSAVAVDDQGRVVVGAVAAARLDRLPAAGVRWFKREMGSSRTFTLAGRVWTATELSALVLAEMKAVAEAVLGHPVTKAVVTVPAYFGEPQRAATLEAARLAGLTVTRILNEPTAAAIAYGVSDPERERRVVVVDFGGGTLDVTLLDIFDGVFEVVGTGGDGRLGGEDATDLLLAWACARAGIPVGGPEHSPVHALLRASCEAAKRGLTTADFTRIVLPAGEGATWVDGPTVVLRRGELATILAPLLDRVVRCVRDTFAAARRAIGDVDEVVLAGGATRMAAVRERLRATFNRDPVEGPDPDLAIAMGAALQGGLVSRHQAVRDIVVTDVLAHSLGVAVSKAGHDRTHDGYFLPVLHRNTTLPVRRVERVYTTHPEQKEVNIQVYSGEHRYILENQPLGSFRLVDLPTGEECHAIDVAFTHDVNGLLEVEAVVQTTGKRASIVLDRQGRLNPGDMERAIEALARLKIVPRDLLPNRLLLEEALARHARLPPDARRLLDGPLFRFEDALAREQPEAIATAAELLRAALTHPSLSLGPD
jgi:molecular chaperone HscC